MRGGAVTQRTRFGVMSVVLWLGTAPLACDDGGAPPTDDAIAEARIRDALPTDDSPPVPVLDATVKDAAVEDAGREPPGGCPDGEIWVSNRCELLCFDDLNCPQDTHCNADVVCLEHPDCVDGGDCPRVCVGWCAPGAPTPPDPCVPACEAGDQRCFGALIRRCELDAAGCPEWSGSVPCPDGALCRDDRCDGPEACMDGCFVDQSQCDGERIRRCVEVEPGCHQWGAVEDCPPDTTCEFNACRCVGECFPNRRECVDGGTRRCMLIEGCGQWGAVEPCDEGTACVDGFCRAMACQHECLAAGIRECVDDLVRTCERDGNRCRVWGAAVACEDGRVCRDDGCVFVCEDDCRIVGAQMCGMGQGGREILRCERDPVTQCRSWVHFTACAAGQRCEEGRCFQ